MCAAGPQAVRLLPSALVLLLVLYTFFGLLLLFNVRQVATGFAGTDPLNQTTTVLWRLAGAVMVAFGMIVLSGTAFQVR